MTWITHSIIFFTASVILYLLIRLAKTKHINATTINLFVFTIPALILFAYLKTNKIPVLLSQPQFIQIIFAAITFWYIGNYLSLKGIELAPNPGFSLIIQKSNAILTVFLAPIIFGSELNIFKVAITFVIIYFTSLIAIDRLEDQQNFKLDKWVIYSIGAFLCFGSLSIFSKYMTSQGVNVFVMFFWVSVVVSNCTFAQMGITNTGSSISKSNFILLTSIGIASAIFNIFLQLAFRDAPNIGYVNIINTSSIAALTVASKILFGDELTKRNLLGIFGVTVCLFLVFI